MNHFNFIKIIIVNNVDLVKNHFYGIRV